jgi:hypothetical protein
MKEIRMKRFAGFTAAVGLGFVSVSLVSAVLSGPIPVTVAADKADLVCVCVVKAVAPGAGADNVSLNVLYVVKGTVSSLSLQAVLPAPSDGYGQVLTPGLVGKPGVWFLIKEGSAFRVQPLYKGLYSERDAYLSIDPLEGQSARTGTVHDQVLSYAVDAYRKTKRTSDEDQRLLASLDFASLGEVSKAVRPLINSTSVDEQVVALAGGLRVNSNDAIQSLAGNPKVVSSLKLGIVADALRLYYRPASLSSLDAIAELVKTRTIVALDAPLAEVLQRAGTTDLGGKAPALQLMMDTMAILLDSENSEARMRASAFFGYVSMFADGHGGLSASNVVGPLSTSVTREFTPRQGSSLTVGQYTQFWKAWWLQNRLGLTSVP